MKEIKFRAWCVSRKKMIYNCMIGGAKGKVFGGNGQFIGLIKNVPVMQYTGLKDKNGKEIYEGDIIELYFDNHTWKGIVEYGIFAQFLVNCIVSNGGVWDFSICGVYEEVTNRLQNFKVIGNIYENKELLEG